MARFEFRLPDIGEGVSEGEIVSWHVAPGQTVAEDEPMVEVMTDKATVTIASPRSGLVTETRAKVGDVVAVHAVLVVFELGEETSVTRGSGNGVGKAATENVASAVGDIREELPGMRLGGGAPVATTASTGAPRPRPSPAVATEARYWNDKPLATPATRKLARDLGVDLRAARPSGPFGRTTTEDVRSMLDRAPDPPSNAPDPQRNAQDNAHSTEPDALADAAVSAATSSATGSERQTAQRRVPLQGLRRRIFENMARAKQTAAHFTFVEECDVTALKELRERMKPAAAERGVKLTFLPFIVKAAVLALTRHPTLNSTFDESTQEIVLHGEQHLGIATATESGLVVPVVKNAGKLSLLAIARELERLATDARANRLQRADLQGSTFTITSLGQKSGLLATPIIHFPEVAILGVHQMKRKPVVRDDAIVIGDVMLLSLSFDHRLIDGHVGAAFAYELIGLLERPETLFLDTV